MIKWIVSSSILILVMIFHRHMGKGKIGARCQYALWILVAVRLLVPFQLGVNVTIDGQPQVRNAVQVNEQWTSEKDYAGFYDEVLEKYENQKNDAVIQEADMGMQKSNFSEKIRHICMIVWGSGAALLGVIFIVTNGWFGARVKRSREKIAVEYVKLPVYLSKEIDTPCLSGIMHTGIYVTKSVAEDPVLLKHAVYHEMTHYRHGDQFWSFVRCVCLALHWYNPLVWWAAKISKKDAEFACDEATIQRLGEEERIEYGRTLIRLTCEKRQDILLATTTLASGKKNISERIQLIAEKPNTGKRAVILSLVAAILITGCTFTEVKAEPRVGVETGIGQCFDEVDWEDVKRQIGEEERGILEKYQIVLEGGQVLWTDRKMPSGATGVGKSVTGQMAITEYIDVQMESMGLETEELVVESFLFSDVFESGELNLCLLLRHVSKSWIILHEEDGAIYGIEVSTLNFKGVQEDGLYFAAGGAGIQYYERMNFKEGDCQFTQVGTALNGRMYDERQKKYSLLEQEKTGDEVAIYTLIEEK